MAHQRNASSPIPFLLSTSVLRALNNQLIKETFRSWNITPFTCIVAHSIEVKLHCSSAQPVKTSQQPVAKMETFQAKILHPHSQERNIILTGMMRPSMLAFSQTTTSALFHAVVVLTDSKLAVDFLHSSFTLLSSTRSDIGGSSLANQSLTRLVSAISPAHLIRQKWSFSLFVLLLTFLLLVAANSSEFSPYLPTICWRLMPCLAFTFSQSQSKL